MRSTFSKLWIRVTSPVERDKIVSGLVAIAVILGMFGFIGADTDYFFKINKGIDVFGRVYKELTLNYVDELDPERLMRSGIEGILSSLDPYTTFIGENEGDDVELLATGKYGGIGVTIGMREGYVTITSLMEGYSAQRQGLQVGDRFIEIEGKSMIGAKPEQVRSLTRGEPGTVVHLKIQREGEPHPLEFALVREEIKIKNISYAGFLTESKRGEEVWLARQNEVGLARQNTDGLAYIRLERFSRGAGDELRLAIKDLQLQGKVKGLILDLRENPGGLLDAAVDVAEKFVPQGSFIVSTRGRKQESEKKYFAREEPVLSSEPLIVLVNRNSASASEIVAGAIQDLDRGVVLGTRTFGKGLVQTITPLVYNTQLKITTAKYYTPSGRSIQEIDYMHKNKDGVFTVTPDSLRREFRTAHRRAVFELGGVTPDTVVETPAPSALFQELLRKSMFFRFATYYLTQHKDSSGVSAGDDALFEEFHRFLEEKNFSYQDPGEVKLKELRELAEKANYSSAVMKEIEKLSSQVREEKTKAFERNKSEILRILKMEFASRYEGERGRISVSLPDDIQVQAARKVLADSKVYKKLLGER